MGMDRGERQRLPFWGKIGAALHRSRYLLTLAVLFRVQMYLFGLPDSSWRDLLKVDILNCMGVMMALLAFCAVLEAETRARAAAAAGLAIAFAAPLISTANLSALPPLLAAYLAPNPAAFSIFPWGAFLAFGVAAGSVLRMLRPADLPRAMQWTALLGFGFLYIGRYWADNPYSLYPKSDFWLDSPMLTLCKLGILLLLASFAYLWTEYLSNPGWSWIRQLGTTSLAVYWVHIELTYGRWFRAWKGALNPWQIALASVALILAMVAMSVAIWKVRIWRAARARARALERAAETVAVS
jgi:hypothetical protein